MKEPSLKWVLIAAVIGITVFLLAFNSYTQLLSHNNATMSNEYTVKYQNLSKYQETYEHWGSDLTFKQIKDIPGVLKDAFLTAVSLGMSVLGNLFTTLTGMKEIIRMLQSEFAENEGLTIMFSLLLTVFTIYLVYRVLSEVRGTQPS